MPSTTPSFRLADAGAPLWRVAGADASCDREVLFAAALHAAGPAGGWTLASSRRAGDQVFLGRGSRLPNLLVKAIGVIRCPRATLIRCIEDAATHERWDPTLRGMRMRDELLSDNAGERVWIRRDGFRLGWPLRLRTMMRLHVSRDVDEHTRVMAYASIRADRPLERGVELAWMGPSLDRFTDVDGERTRIERCQWINLGGVLATRPITALLRATLLPRGYLRDLHHIRRFAETASTQPRPTESG